MKRLGAIYGNKFYGELLDHIQDTFLYDIYERFPDGSLHHIIGGINIFRLYWKGGSWLELRGKGTQYLVVLHTPDLSAKQFRDVIIALDDFGIANKCGFYIVHHYYKIRHYAPAGHVRYTSLRSALRVFKCNWKV